jgi:uncharacterized protein YlxW (UPF0749 family)
MKSMLRLVSMFVLLGAGVALAAEKQTSSKDAMAHAKSMAMKERSDMMEKTKAIDAQVSEAMKTAKNIEGEKAKALESQLAELQKQVKALGAQLEKAPKYFDDPTANPLKP